MLLCSRDINSTVCSSSSISRRSFKLGHNYTLKASLRRYSSLAISSATHPGISGMATWMTYFRRIAKCCGPPTTQRDNKLKGGLSQQNNHNQYVIFLRPKNNGNHMVCCHFFVRLCMFELLKDDLTHKHIKSTHKSNTHFQHIPPTGQWRRWSSQDSTRETDAGAVHTDQSGNSLL